jgi:starch phosphorylase
MVIDYTDKMYIPSLEKLKKISDDNYSQARNLSEWKAFMIRSWPQVQITADASVNQSREQKSLSGENIEIGSVVSLGDMEPSNVKVELYYGSIGRDNTIIDPSAMEMQLKEKTGNGTYKYNVNMRLLEGGQYGYTFRVLPYHPDLINNFDMGLVKWVVQ